MGFVFTYMVFNLFILTGCKISPYTCTPTIFFSSVSLIHMIISPYRTPCLNPLPKRLLIQGIPEPKIHCHLLLLVQISYQVEPSILIPIVVCLRGINTERFILMSYEQSHKWTWHHTLVQRLRFISLTFTYIVFNLLILTRFETLPHTCTLTIQNQFYLILK